MSFTQRWWTTDSCGVGLCWERLCWGPEKTSHSLKHFCELHYHHHLPLFCLVLHCTYIHVHVVFAPVCSDEAGASISHLFCVVGMHRMCMYCILYNIPQYIHIHIQRETIVRCNIYSILNRACEADEALYTAFNLSSLFNVRDSILNTSEVSCPTPPPLSLSLSLRPD